MKNAAQGKSHSCLLHSQRAQRRSQQRCINPEQLHRFQRSCSRFIAMGSKIRISEIHCCNGCWSKRQYNNFRRRPPHPPTSQIPSVWMASAQNVEICTNVGKNNLYFNHLYDHILQIYCTGDNTGLSFLFLKSLCIKSASILCRVTQGHIIK